MPAFVDFIPALCRNEWILAMMGRSPDKVNITVEQRIINLRICRLELDGVQAVLLSVGHEVSNLEDFPNDAMASGLVLGQVPAVVAARGQVGVAAKARASNDNVALLEVLV